MTDDKKTCPHCGKTLRSDNTRGACSDCLKAGKAAPELEDKPRKKSDTLKRFRTVATALGKGADAILEEAADAWLAALREAADK